MEIRVLRYFLAIAREGNMTHAAERLHVSQPTLSRQMKELERELGCKLFRRGSTSVSLTDEGMLLRRRAEDILSMVDKTEREFGELGEVTGGDVRIGCAETRLVAHLARSVVRLRETCPDLRIHITSGDTEQVAERLDRGLLDLALIAEPPDLGRYNHLELPGADAWGVVVRRDSPLAQLASATAEDLMEVPLFCSPQSIANDLPRWCEERVDQLRIAGTVNLFYNGTVLVREGLGALLTFEGLASTGPGTGLAFVPLEPRLETREYVIWRRYQEFTPIASLLLRQLEADLRPGT